GYWIDVERRTTINGLFAAGDIAGGAPKKYVSGAWVEGKIAARAAIEEVKGIELQRVNSKEVRKEKERISSFMNDKNGIPPAELEQTFHKVMDEYAGGATKNYELLESKLIIARKKIRELTGKLEFLSAKNRHELVSCLELIDRFDVAKVLIEHLIYRQETRWPCYQSRVDFPKRNDINWLKFINSVYDPVDNRLTIVERPLK
ncbi:MAG: adenylylsulfate reductase, partial [Candidatus Scalindua sediminis]